MHRLQHRGRELLAGVFVVRHIGDALLGELEHIAEGGIRMREAEGGDTDLWVHRDRLATGKFAEIDLGAEQVFHLDREKGMLDLVLHQLHQRIARASFAIDHEVILRGKCGGEKGEALDVIPMRVR
jgi:hypothetical protein